MIIEIKYILFAGSILLASCILGFIFFKETILEKNGFLNSLLEFAKTNYYFLVILLVLILFTLILLELMENVSELENDLSLLKKEVEGLNHLLELTLNRNVELANKVEFIRNANKNSQITINYLRASVGVLVFVVICLLLKTCIGGRDDDFKDNNISEHAESFSVDTPALSDIVERAIEKNVEILPQVKTYPVEKYGFLTVHNFGDTLSMYSYSSYYMMRRSGNPDFFRPHTTAVDGMLPNDVLFFQKLEKVLRENSIPIDPGAL